MILFLIFQKNKNLHELKYSDVGTFGIQESKID